MMLKILSRRKNNLSQKEQAILDSIKVASENNPRRPEFPSDSPRFPATPTDKIEIDGFSNVWLKDESVNPTGTHKDRMAWEVVVSYKQFLTAKKRGQTNISMPTMSIISSGSAAVAIQTQLKKYNLPSLKVLVDIDLDKKILNYLSKIGSVIYSTNLSQKSLSEDEILKLTENPTGFDITSSEALDPTTRFYDWMSYEIINSSPDFCFIPFGTGNLYENVLNVSKREITAEKHDPRFRGKVDKLRDCVFLGATTNSMKSKADKLYSPHLPFVHYGDQWMRFYRYAGYCGFDSGVFVFEEQYLDKAMKIAQKNNISAEPSGIAGLALLLQMKGKIQTDRKILIVNTGKVKYE